MEPFIGMIVMFGGNFAPRGWAFCDGQLLPISTAEALFSIIGTTYGGDGRTTFALPDLRGRFAMHPGNGPGLTSRQLGQKSGSESHVLTVANLPSHTHAITTNVVVRINDNPGDQRLPRNHLIARANDGENNFASDNSAGQLGGVSATSQCAAAGSGQSVNHVPPFQTVNFIIALVGIFPSRS